MNNCRIDFNDKMENTFATTYVTRFLLIEIPWPDEYWKEIMKML